MRSQAHPEANQRLMRLPPIQFAKFLTNSLLPSPSERFDREGNDLQHLDAAILRSVGVFAFLLNIAHGFPSWNMPIRLPL